MFKAFKSPKEKKKKKDKYNIDERNSSADYSASETDDTSYDTNLNSSTINLSPTSAHMERLTSLKIKLNKKKLTSSDLENESVEWKLMKMGSLYYAADPIVEAVRKYAQDQIAVYKSIPASRPLSR